MKDITFGVMKFSVEIKAPDYTKIPPEDVVDISAILITCSYKSKEFIRIGYYVHNHYEDPMLQDNPPPIIAIDKVVKTIIHDQPRITKFPIDWESFEIVNMLGNICYQQARNDLVQGMNAFN